MQASRPTSTPGSGGTGPLPSYMAPTAAAIGRAKDGQRLKSKVVVPEDYDPRSLGQIRKQLKEATAKKSASAAAGSSQPVIKVRLAMHKKHCADDSLCGLLLVLSCGWERRRGVRSCCADSVVYVCFVRAEHDRDAQAQAH